MNAMTLLQAGSVFAMNIGFTWLVGAWCARRWIAQGLVRHYARLLRQWDLAAAGLAMAGSALSLWAATAVMSDTGLDEAAAMVPMMLTSTAYGHAGIMSTAALALLFLCRAVVSHGAIRDAIPAAALLGFAAARASMGHAGENGWLTATMLAETVHYAAIGVWTGAVAVSGWLVLRQHDTFALAGQAASRYLDGMSVAASWALAAIIVTGAYNAWHRIGPAGNLLSTAYGITLLVKIGLVLVASALGGYNKVIGLPRASRSAHGLVVVRRVLQAETFVLFAVLAAAAILTAQPPPAAM